MNKVTRWALITALKILGGKKMEKFRQSLSGKKTYLMALANLIKGVIEYIGDGNLGNLINNIIVSGTMCTVRVAIKKGEVGGE